MRIWTVHPRYLDVKGLTAVWRETLLAQKVLLGGTRGYRNHPQLIRFKALPDPAAAVAAYLEAILEEARVRGYAFDPSRIQPRRDRTPVTETEGQLLYEWSHLLNKLQQRDPQRYAVFKGIIQPDPHPLFSIIPGDVREWEKR